MAPDRTYDRSADVDHGALVSLAAFHDWWAERHRHGRFAVDRIAFSALDAWSFERRTGNLRHTSGRFFAVEGLQVRDGSADTWCQPVINQPEIGILGILVKEFDGVLHFLMQAKMEPGNVNLVQLSPTVQATRSNYTEVHQGTSTRYLEYFVDRALGRVLVDVLQSEQGAWFWRKRNRNMVVWVSDDVPVHEDYCWLTLAQIRELTRVDNLVNMDARTVLSCLPFALPDEGVATQDPFRAALVHSYRSRGRPAALYTSGEILSWFTEAKTRCDWTARLVPLGEVNGWSISDEEISEQACRHFQIIAVGVEASTREVQRWTQPMLYPQGVGYAVFVVRPIDGVMHLLVQAQPEFGLTDLVELAPTLHLRPGTELSGAPDPLLYQALASPGARTRYDAVLSEEGGRFYQALTRYQIVEVGEEVPVRVPPNYCWLTVRQLMDLLAHPYYINIQARSLLACLHSLW